jgi:hypothetical protein
MRRSVVVVKTPLVRLIDWLIWNWVRGLAASMHLGLNWRALCAPFWLMGACYLAKVLDGPQTYICNILWLQEGLVRPVTALDCVLLKDKNLALVSRQGSEISSWACLWVLPRPRHHPQCWLTNQRLMLLLISCLETPKAGSGPTNPEAELPLVSPSAISLPLTPACPGTQGPACEVTVTVFHDTFS